jgi:transcriptional regulator with XRE-family HTH domain
MIQTSVSEARSAETIGARLKRLRLQRGLSQRDLSSPGVSYAYISRIEAGARTPSVKALRKLAQKLGVSVEYLETGRDIREVDDRELRLADAELELRLADDIASVEQKLEQIYAEADAAGDRASASLRLSAEITSKRSNVSRQRSPTTRRRRRISDPTSTRRSASPTRRWGPRTARCASSRTASRRCGTTFQPTRQSTSGTQRS